MCVCMCVCVCVCSGSAGPVLGASCGARPVHPAVRRERPQRRRGHRPRTVSPPLRISPCARDRGVSEGLCAVLSRKSGRREIVAEEIGALGGWLGVCGQPTIRALIGIGLRTETGLAGEDAEGCEYGQAIVWCQRSSLATQQSARQNSNLNAEQHVAQLLPMTWLWSYTQCTLTQRRKGTFSYSNTQYFHQIHSILIYGM